MMDTHETLLSPHHPSEIARKENVTPRYIGRLIKLAFLAPDIMQAIFKGEIPSALSLGSLIKEAPLNWEAQRQMLGFSTKMALTGTRKISV